MALSLNLTGLRKQYDYFICRETGHDSSSIDEIVEISYRTNKHGFFIHPSTNCEISYLKFSGCLVIVYFLFSTTDLEKYENNETHSK